jgi:tRNA pseudouridine55 synthase
MSRAEGGSSRSDGPGGLDGLAVVDKPAGMTSHDVVAKARRALGTRKIGHAGTLDPDATGVLLLGVGRVTRLLRFFSELPKSYVCELVLGVETSTLDAAGEVTATHDMSGVTPEDVRAAAARFVGAIEQIPPMVSAVKVGGRRLHELAREGVEVERAPRPVTVHRLEVEPTDDPLVYRLEADCSSGTYVRTLAADIGHALGGGAHLRALRRTAIGPHTLAEARGLDDLVLLPPSAAVAHLPSVSVAGDDVRRVATGRTVLQAAGDGPVAVLEAGSGELLAVYEGGRPQVVLVQRVEGGPG